MLSIVYLLFPIVPMIRPVGSHVISSAFYGMSYGFNGVPLASVIHHMVCLLLTVVGLQALGLPVQIRARCDFVQLVVRNPMRS